MGDFRALVESADLLDFDECQWIEQAYEESELPSKAAAAEALRALNRLRQRQPGAVLDGGCFPVLQGLLTKQTESRRFANSRRQIKQRVFNQEAYFRTAYRIETPTMCLYDGKACHSLGDALKRAKALRRLHPQTSLIDIYRRDAKGRKVLVWDAGRGIVRRTEKI